MATNAPPVIITDHEEHPAKRCKAGYITVGVFEVIVSLTIIIIGAISLQQATRSVHSLIKTTENLSEETVNNLNKLQYSNSYNHDDQMENINNVLSTDEGKQIVSQGLDTASNAFLAFGLFTGAFFLITSGLAIASGSCPNNCNIIAGMVMCIFSAIFAAGRFLFGVGMYASINMVEDNVKSGEQALHIISISCSAIMFMTAIIHSALCCAHTCCKGKGTRSTTVVQHTIPMQPGYPNGAAPYYDQPSVHQGYTPEYVDDRMNRKLIEE